MTRLWGAINKTKDIKEQKTVSMHPLLNVREYNKANSMQEKLTVVKYQDLVVYIITASSNLLTCISSLSLLANSVSSLSLSSLSAVTSC